MRIFLLFIVCFVCCAPPTQLFRLHSIEYTYLTGKTVAYSKPVVIASEIFYENRFTSQNYHSIDRSRTEDAFFRDYKAAIEKAKLPWQEAKPATDSCIQKQFSRAGKKLDSLPENIRIMLRRDSTDILVLIYAMRLFHHQSVGLRPDSAQSFSWYGSTISRRVEFICTAFDCRTNKMLFSIPIKREVHTTSLNILEQSVGDLFRILLNSRS